MSSKLNSVFLSFVLIALAGQASGQVTAYSNLSISSANPNQNFTDILSMGQSFTSSASGLISSLSLNVSTISPNRPVYDVELWSDSGGSTPLPTTLLATLVIDRKWNLDQVSPPDSSHVATLSASAFSNNYSLVSGTTYWLVIATTDGPNKSWGVSSASGGPSAAYRLSTHQWGAFPLSGALGLAVSVIPEPGACAAWGGIIVLGFAIGGRRRPSLSVA